MAATWRWAALLALATSATPSAAADCAAIASGKVPFHGTAFMRSTADKEGVPTTFSYQPGETVKVSFKRADGFEGGYEIVNGHQTSTSSTQPRPYHFEYALQPIEGDPAVMNEGAMAKYRDVVTKDGAAAFEEVVEQTIGATSVRKVDDCSFTVVRLYRNGALTPADTTRQTRYDYVPALQISVWNETVLATKSGPKQVGFEMTSVADGP